MARLSVCIMAHVSRRHLWQPLADTLGMNTHLSVDDGTLGRWGNGRRSLLAYDSGASHHLVIQDDAVPAADLLDGITDWLDHLPESILCLYSGRLKLWRRIHQRNAQPPCFLQMAQIQWGVALVVPTRHIDTLVAQGDRMDKIGNYDLRLSEANLRTAKLPVLYPSPSWVDHAETPSLVPGRMPNRHALCALSPEESVHDWAHFGDVPIIAVPEFHRRPNGQQHYRSMR